MQKYSCNENFFKNDSEDSFYWAGYIAADGCMRIKNTTYSKVLSLELNSVDHDHIAKLVKILDFKVVNNNYGNQKFIAPFYKKKKLSHLYLNSKVIFNDLKDRFLIEPLKTKTHYFPNHLKTHPLINHFVRGYFDGDGGFYLKKSGQMTLRVCGTLDFLNQYKNVIENNAGFISTSKPYIYNGQGALNYGGNIQIRKIGNYIYNNANVFMERKLNQFKSAPEPRYIRNLNG